MRRLNRYLGRTVLAASLGSLVVLVFLLFISSLVAEIQDLSGNYTLGSALAYVAWQLPSHIHESLTFAAFLGCVIGLGIHASANELVIFRAAGVSMVRIVWATMRPVLLLVGGGLLWGEYVTPVSLQLAEGVKASSQADDGALASSAGHWYLEDNTFLYFSGLNRRLYGVTQYQLDDRKQRLESSSFSASATYFGNGWQLEDGRQSRFNRAAGETPSVSVQRYNRQQWDTELNPEFLNDLVLPEESLSIGRLYRYAKERDQQGLESRELWLSFWTKLLQPLVMIALALVGMSFIFGSLREATMGSRITVAVLVGILFTITQEFLASSSLVFNFSPLLAVLVPIGLCMLLGVFMLKKQ